MNGSRKWFITGASTGLGRVMAEQALACGDTVAATFRKEEARAAFEASAPGRAFGYLMDVTDWDAVARVAAEAEAATGGIDILVNNAGYGLMGAIEEVSGDELRQQFETNVFGPVAVLKAFLPGMRTRRSGHVINITSVSGLAPWPGGGIYGASKYALECIGQTLAGEVAGFGIKVTNVAPGELRTEFSSRSLQLTDLIIDDYADGAHQARQTLSVRGGTEGGDPQKAAAAILAIAGSDDAPLHLILGRDAYFYAGAKAGSFISEIAKWAPVSLSIEFDDAAGGTFVREV